MFIEVIDNNDSLTRVRRNWDAVYDADPEAQFFLSWTWMFNWLCDIDSQWIILAAKPSAESCDYVAFFPLQLRTDITKEGGLRNSFSTAGGYFAGYTGFICTSEAQNQAIPAFADYLLRRNWTSIRLDNFCASDHRLNLFLRAFPENKFISGKTDRPDDGDHIDHDIYLSVKLPADWETYLDTSLSANSRKKARRALRMLDQSPDLRITETSADTFQHDLKILLRLWEAQWSQKLATRYGEKIPRGLLNNFHNMLIRSFKAGVLSLPILWQGEKPVAAIANLIDRKKATLLSLVGSRDVTVDTLKPGLMLDLHSMRWAIQNGLATYDLLTGNYPYKYSFGPQERRIECMGVVTRTEQNLGNALDRETLSVATERVRAFCEAGNLLAAERSSSQILDVDPQHPGLLALLDQYRSAGRFALSESLADACAAHRRRNAAHEEQARQHIDIIDNSEAFARLRSNWEAVYEADPEGQFYMSWTWMWNWLEKIDCQWVILALKADAGAAHYVGFFALQLRTLMREDGVFYNVIRMGGDPFATYNSFICMPGFQDHAVTAFANYIRGMNWTDFVLDNVAISESRLRPFLSSFPSAEFDTKTIARPDEGDHVDYGIYPYIKLPNDWETYLTAKLSPKARQKARQFLKLVDQPGEFRITLADADTIERDMDILLRFWEIRWKPKYSEASMRSMLTNNRKMLMRCFAEGSLFLPVLWKGDTPIAARAALLDKTKRTLICLVIGRDLSFRHPSPGFMLNIYSLRWAIRNGLTTYDMQQGNAPYKYEFAPQERRIDCLLVSTRSKRNRGERLEPRSLPVVLQRAQGLEGKGRFTEAETVCRQILHADPEHAGARNLLARLAAAKNNRIAADFTKALEAHQRGQLAEAERLYGLVLAADPKHFDATHLLGVVFLQRNELDAAERQIDLAIGINPSFAAAHNNRGNALRAAKRIADALASYERALAFNPDYAEAHNNRGCALLDLGRMDDALPNFDKAIALKPDYAVALCNRGNLLKGLGRLKDALASYDKAIALIPDFAEAIANRNAVLKDLASSDEPQMKDDREVMRRQCGSRS